MGAFYCIVALLLQVLSADAQTYPSCADSCISAAVPLSCSSSDNVCICQNLQPSGLLSCLASSCSCGDQTTALATLDSLCVSNGVQLALTAACPTSSVSSLSDASSSSTLTTLSTISTSDTAAGISSLLIASTAVVVYNSNVVTTLITSTNWYTPSTSSPTTTSISSSTSYTATVADSTASLSNHGVSSGVKAGIGGGVAGVAVFAFGFAGCLYWFCRRKRHQDSIAPSDRYPPSPGPNMMVGVTPHGDRPVSDPPSQTASQKEAFSWGPSSPPQSLQHRALSDSSNYGPAGSDISDNPQNGVDPMAYQRPVMGQDGHWYNAQELQGDPGAGSAYPGRTTYHGGTTLPPAVNRPIVPPGKWPPAF